MFISQTFAQLALKFLCRQKTDSASPHLGIKESRSVKCGILVTSLASLMGLCPLPCPTTPRSALRGQQSNLRRFSWDCLSLISSGSAGGICVDRFASPLGDGRGKVNVSGSKPAPAVSSPTSHSGLTHLLERCSEPVPAPTGERVTHYPWALLHFICHHPPTCRNEPKSLTCRCPPPLFFVQSVLFTIICSEGEAPNGMLWIELCPLKRYVEVLIDECELLWI